MRAIREQTASAIDLLVHINRGPDGVRRVAKISAIDGMEGDLITLSDLFVFEVTDTKPGGAIHGALRSTGIRPKLAERLHDQGIDLPANLFDS